MRSPTIRRMALRGTVSFTLGGPPVALVSISLARCTSWATISPFVPLPFKDARSTPLSLAILLAAGEAAIRPRIGAAWAFETDEGSGGETVGAAAAAEGGAALVLCFGRDSPGARGGGDRCPT